MMNIRFDAWYQGNVRASYGLRCKVRTGEVSGLSISPLFAALSMTMANRGGTWAKPNEERLCQAGSEANRQRKAKIIAITPFEPSLAEKLPSTPRMRHWPPVKWSLLQDHEEKLKPGSRISSFRKRSSCVSKHSASVRGVFETTFVGHEKTTFAETITPTNGGAGTELENGRVQHREH